jgi:biofilm PGA synthesis N-glycosyltransferase PgaC
LQVLGYVFVVLALIFDQIAWQYAIAIFVVVLLAGQLQTAGAILIEQVGYERYRRRDLMLIGAWSLLEIFWFRPLTAFWRIWATILFVAGRRPGWGSIPRGAALATPESEIEPAPLPR